MSRFTESVVEEAALSWCGELGYSTLAGPQIAPGEPSAERAGLGEAILPERLRVALERLNPNIPAEALDEVFRKLTLAESPSLIVNNRSLHRLLVDGIAVEFSPQSSSYAPSPQPSPKGRGSKEQWQVGTTRSSYAPSPQPSPKGRGSEEVEYQRRHDIVRVIDFENADANDWVAVNQFTMIEGQRNRRPDVVIFVNGLPLGVIELKNAATLWDAFNQIKTYKLQIPSLFLHNAVAVISDGLEARVGSISADKERFMPWRTITGDDYYPPLRNSSYAPNLRTLSPSPSPRGRGGEEEDLEGRLAPTTPSPQPSPKGRGSVKTELEVLLRGVFDKRRFLDLIRHFIVFEEDTSDGTIIKKMAGYHQFHAVNTAVEATLRATLFPSPSPRGRGEEDLEGPDSF